MNVTRLSLCWKHYKHNTTERKEGNFTSNDMSVFIKASCVGLPRCEEVQRAASVLLSSSPTLAHSRTPDLKLAPNSSKQTCNNLHVQRLVMIWRTFNTVSLNTFYKCFMYDFINLHFRHSRHERIRTICSTLPFLFPVLFF